MLIFVTTPGATLSSFLRSRAALELENLALRHQIGVLQRSAAKRPKLTSRDRLLWICFVPPLARLALSAGHRGPRLVAAHKRILEPTGRKYRLPEHRHQRGQAPQRSDSCPEEKLLLARLPEAAEYLEALKKRYPGRVTLPLRRLLRLVNDYPRAPLLEVLQAATQYGLFDLERLESMILRKLAREYFQLKPDPDDGDEE